MAKDQGGTTLGGRRAGAPKKVARRGRAGLRALAATLPKVTHRALGRRGFAEGGLASEWTSVMGKEIAARCRPAKLVRARPGGSSEGVLTLRVEPGFAIELQHLAPLLIERINGHFGASVVHRLRFLQAPLAPLRPPANTRTPRPVDPRDEAALKLRAATVDDENLRGALERLGRAVHQYGDP